MKSNIPPTVPGSRYGRLVVLGKAPHRSLPGGQRCRQWHCRCDCGREVIVLQLCLRKGGTRSCGCLRREIAADKGRRSAKHGMQMSPEFKVWKGMVDRCRPSAPAYAYYGARGIAVCLRWRRDFLAFYADMGDRPSPKHSIDRINNDGGYWCGKCAECVLNDRSANCRWATWSQQMRNRRRR